jgi:N-acetylglucosamine malate deacetylase 1
MNKVQANCDLLVVSPHTDDAEIGLGGTIATLAAAGRKVWVLDLTQGELGSNATPDQRWQEAAEASGILGLHGRIQLSLPDGFINSTDPTHIAAVVWALRTFRPQTVVSAPDPVRHPDHIATADLVRRAAFLARLIELQAEAPKYRRWIEGAEIPSPESQWKVPTVLSVCPDDVKPSLLFDISEKWQLKEKALACYASQFKREEGRRNTHINDGDFLRKIERRALCWGDRAGKTRAEAFCTENVPVVDDFSQYFGWRS